MRTLNLDKLKEGLPGITPGYGTFLAEAAAFCLMTMWHSPGVKLSVHGDFEEDFHVEWTEEIGVTHQTSWGDLKEATEYGATALAILMIEILTGFDFFERNPQLKPGDYVLKKTNLHSPGQQQTSNQAVMEISGILEESETNRIEARISIKEARLRKTKRQNLPGYVVVVEFGKPTAKIIVTT